MDDFKRTYQLKKAYYAVNYHSPYKTEEEMDYGVIALIVIVAAINIFVMQGKKKGASTNADAVSFEKVTERKLNNTKLICGQMKPGNIESFYADSAKGKVKDIEIKEGQEVEKGTKLFSYDNEEINLQMKQAELDQIPNELSDGQKQRILPATLYCETGKLQKIEGVRYEFTR